MEYKKMNEMNEWMNSVGPVWGPSAP